VRSTGRLQSCVRPVGAVSHAAGLDGFHGSRPHQLVGTRIPLRRSGLSRSRRVDRLCHHVFSLSQAYGTRQLSNSCCDCHVTVGVLSAHDGPSYTSRLVCQSDCHDEARLSAEQ